ncbi:MAG: fructose-bisphosphatase class II [Candidatus Dadabacteria bacterium]|nr:MAG: fructose-bisphosphatase class II [Candidatus Dadabacteria bacterium]
MSHVSSGILGSRAMVLKASMNDYYHETNESMAGSCLMSSENAIPQIDRGVGIDVVRLTEGAARRAARHMGRGDEALIFREALAGLTESLNLVNLRGRFVLGQSMPELQDRVDSGEHFGEGSRDVDLAVHPVECLTACALGGRNSMSALVVAPTGTIPAIPDVYMEKLACGHGLDDTLSFDMTVAEILETLAVAKGSRIEELTVTILDRPRNREWIEATREAGARVRLIADGDLAAAIATCVPDSGVDLLVGSGGAFEGFLAAAAVSGMGGSFVGRYVIKSEEHHRLVLNAGIDDPRRVLHSSDLLPGEYVFSATGITDGDVLPGVRFHSGTAISESLMVRTASHTVRRVRSEHKLH